ncbi:histone-lysine N-methyltransferase eggless [Culicoides brevitarsis]|uniref:histone-lysine N-methyltransferase eggless n=1 Tax=Culicoides brevitarsis TaxID=469753 RepID=UPI00307C1624
MEDENSQKTDSGQNETISEKKEENPEIESEFDVNELSGGDYLVLDEITGSQDPPNATEKEQESMEVIDLESSINTSAEEEKLLDNTEPIPAELSPIKPENLEIEEKEAESMTIEDASVPILSELNNSEPELIEIAKPEAENDVETAATEDMSDIFPEKEPELVEKEEEMDEKESEIMTIDDDDLEPLQLSPDEAEKEPETPTTLIDESLTIEESKMETSEVEINPSEDTPIVENAEKDKEIPSETTENEAITIETPSEVSFTEPTVPATEPMETEENSFSTNLTSQILAALEKAKKQDETSTETPKTATNEVVELLDDDEDAPPPAPENAETEETTKEAEEVKPARDHECVNPNCDRRSNEFQRARKVIVNYFRQNSEKLKKKQFVCASCYDFAVEKYRGYTETLLEQQPLLLMEMPKHEEVVELLSDGEDDSNDENSSDEEPLPQETLDLLSSELEKTLSDVLEKVKASQQIDWSVQIMRAQVENNQKIVEENDKLIQALEQQATTMYRKLYAVNEVQYHNVPALEIMSTNDGRMYTEKNHLPLPGPTFRPPITLSSVYYAVKQRLLSTWCQCKVLDVIEDASKAHHFRVQFIDSKVNNVRVVSPKQIAYSHPPTTRLSVGERVIAHFNMNPSAKPMGGGTHQSHFYPGIIAEPLQPYNMFRYLIFFDDGYAQYVTPQDVRLVYDVSETVWEDVHPHSKEFIQNYLQTYKKERPMVQAKPNQKINTEFKGKWEYAKVLEVDASLIRVYFHDAKKTEWIYRGSTRLAPLFKQRESATKKRSHDPSIEYVSMNESNDASARRPAPPPSDGSEPPVKRAVARKSSAARPPSNTVTRTEQQIQQLQKQRQEQRNIKFMNSNTIILDDDAEEKGRVVYFAVNKNFEKQPFRPHTCSPDCLLKVSHNMMKYSPTAKPLICAWDRQLVKQKLKRTVMYTAPCGRRLRNINEVYQYLKMTKCRLGIECFDFDEKLHCLAEYQTNKKFYYNPDISEGREGMPIPCVNSYDETKPPPCEYSANRIPTEGVNLNTDPEFMCGCDCTNDCIDKEKCACQNLTLAGARWSNPTTPIEQVGYQYKRLYEQIAAGIYECNPNCKCSKKTCLNRVVQHPIQNRIELFKTFNMGWGLRATTDIPKGTFICIYAGYLLTDEKANTDNGDEYFADLDYIELVEQLKNGYESDAPEMTDPESDYDPNEDSMDGDRDFRPSNGVSSGNTRSVRSTRSSKNVDQLMERAKVKDNSKPASRSGSDDEDSREKISLMPNSDPDAEENVNSKYTSLRKLYGKNESVYVMDAKICGNIGRYFNHSCDPNMFVQNVFVDTHDLRFPWVAFFSSRYIKAGTELTWDYNYEVGSIDGKILYCECGSAKCRIRLL